jgi:hypothetical protein
MNRDEMIKFLMKYIAQTKIWQIKLLKIWSNVWRDKGCYFKITSRYT